MDRSITLASWVQGQHEAWPRLSPESQGAEKQPMGLWARLFFPDRLRLGKSGSCVHI